MFHAVRHAYAFQSFLHVHLPLARRHIAVRQRQLDVFVDREIANQIKCLEDEADFPIANAGSIAHFERLDRRLVQHILPIRRCVQ